MMREWTNQIFTEYPFLEKIRPAIAPIATATATVLGIAGIESITNLAGIHSPPGFSLELWRSILHNPELKAVSIAMWMTLNRMSISWITTPYENSTLTEEAIYG